MKNIPLTIATLILSISMFVLSATIVDLTAKLPTGPGAKLLQKQPAQAKPILKRFKTNKKLIRIFYRPSCPHCQRLQNVTLKDKEIKKLLERYEVKMIRTDKPENREIVREANIKYVPTIFIEDKRVASSKQGLLSALKENL